MRQSLSYARTCYNLNITDIGIGWPATLRPQASSGPAVGAGRHALVPVAALWYHNPYPAICAPMRDNCLPFVMVLQIVAHTTSLMPWHLLTADGEQISQDGGPHLLVRGWPPDAGYRSHQSLSDRSRKSAGFAAVGVVAGALTHAFPVYGVTW